ncbi:MAG: type II toxin-antitoxin system VapC family toxin [Pseudomonadota bacterium]
MALPFTLAAVGTNFLIDLAVPRDKAHDALEIFRRRAPAVEFVVVPTVIDELDYIARHGDTPAHRRPATSALQKLVRVWKLRPLDFIPAGHGIIETVARKLRREKLIPEQEVNDSFILAEAALAHCTLLITSDEHIRAADPVLLNLTLKSCDVNAIVVRTRGKLSVNSGKRPILEKHRAGLTRSREDREGFQAWPKQDRLQESDSRISRLRVRPQWDGARARAGIIFSRHPVRPEITVAAPARTGLQIHLHER